jgi:mannosyltransferase
LPGIVSTVRQHWLVGAIGLVALGLRLWGLDRKSVWFDEVVTWIHAHQTWPELLESLRQDVHPPLSYMLYHLWPATDAGDFWLRLPSAVLGTLAVAMCFAWASLIGTRVQALIAAAFVAFSALQIDLAQEARMYGLLLLLTATSLWLLDRLLVRPGRGTAAAYAVCCAGLLYTHYYGGFILAAESLALLAPIERRSSQESRARLQHAFWKRTRARWLAVGALAVAAVSFVPWLTVLAEQAGNIAGDYWIARPTLATLWVTFRDLAAHTPPDEPFRVALRIAYAVQATLLVVGAWLAVRNPRQASAVALAVVPIGLALAISWLVAPVYAVRYVSPVGLAFGFLLARGVTALPKVVNLAAGAVAFLPVALSLGPLYTDPGYSRADLRAAAHAVQAARTSDEVVVHMGAFTLLPFEYYEVRQPLVVLETNDRTELCDALLSHPGGWLVTAYATDDDAARDAAETGITAESYARKLITERPLRFPGVTSFQLRGPC